MIDWIKKRKLNNTSALCIGITYTIAIFSLFFYMVVIPDNAILHNVGNSIMTSLVPAFINFLIIPAFKVISFYQNIDEKIIEGKVTKEKINYYNEKQKVYTEALLTCTTALPIFLLYVFKVAYFLFQKHLSSLICVTLIIAMILVIIGVWALIKKLRR
ncbi:hypothetical protein [Staphylococcus gallinarum]|uniref:hypothetical protein n=1 Tax=Staphylococcus TaxID=1279 RepID=UPI000E6A62E4|nr:hypothetical protein [Staphylococcus gallinarum]RIL23375.1 hypothetical protein BUY99_05140 [Staphylococcus gallinarum]